MPPIFVQRGPLLDGALLDATVANDLPSKHRQAIPNKYPLVRLATSIAQHCEDNVILGIPPAPAAELAAAVGSLQRLS